MSDRWYVGRDGRQSGPFSLQELRGLKADGRLAAHDLVWREGLAEWVAAATVPEVGTFGTGGTLPPIDFEGFGSARPSGLPRDRGDWNPYAAPADSDGLAADAAAPLVYARFLPRVVALVLDQIFLMLLATPLAFAIGLMIGLGNARGDGFEALGNLVGLLVSAIYSIGLESSSSQATWGKRLMGIRVTDLQGRRLSVARAAGRFAAKFITALTLGLGYLLPLASNRKQTLHDLLAGCLALER